MFHLRGPTFIPARISKLIPVLDAQSKGLNAFDPPVTPASETFFLEATHWIRHTKKKKILKYKSDTEMRASFKEQSRGAREEEEGEKKGEEEASDGGEEPWSDADEVTLR